MANPKWKYGKEIVKNKAQKAAYIETTKEEEKQKNAKEGPKSGILTYPKKGWRNKEEEKNKRKKMLKNLKKEEEKQKYAKSKHRRRYLPYLPHSTLGTWKEKEYCQKWHAEPTV